MSLSLIPHSDTLAFSAMPKDVRDEVMLWAGIIAEIDAAKSKCKAMAEIAKRYPGSKSLSDHNIKTKYYAFRREGWKALVNKAKLSHSHPLVAPKSHDGQPPSFIQYWKGLQESYQRSSQAAYRELVRRYRSGADIPGIGNWRSVWAEKRNTLPPDTFPVNGPMPGGWSLRNLSRPQFRPTKFELTVCRQGRSAAAKFRPKVITTRVGMEVGQIYVFDDVKHDNLVTMIGQLTPMCPLEFCCIDYFSACQIAYGSQPTIKNMETGKKKMLEEKEMRFLLAHVLLTVGFHPAGCQLQMEHGSATVRKDLEEILLMASNDRLLVEKGGIDRRPAHDGYFMCRPKGNSRFKAALESLHNLKHNDMALLAGQTGKDRDHSPEALHGLIKYNEDLLKVAFQYPDLAERLNYPTLEFNQWKQAVKPIYERINGRTDHHLEGWIEAGLVRNRFQLIEGGDEIPMEVLDKMEPAKRAAIEAAMIPLPPRRLSPAEVFHAGSKKLEKLPMSFAPLILGEQNALPKRLGHDSLFTFEEMRIGPGQHQYVGRAHTPEGTLIPLDPGKEYLLWISPFDPSGVFVADLRGAFIGACKLWDRVCRTDTEGVHRKIGKAESIHSDLLVEVKQRHAAEARERMEMMEGNDRLLIQAGLRPEKKVSTPKFADAPAPGVDLISMYDNQD